MASAAPFAGKIPFTQPNGTQIELWGEGDEFHADFETLDGFTVMFDPATKTYYYAQLSADGNDLVSSGVAVGSGTPVATGLAKHLRINRETARQRALERREEWETQTGVRDRWNKLKATRQSIEAAAGASGTEQEPQFSPPWSTTVGVNVGLTLLIDFSDDPATIPQGEVINFLNSDSYTGYGNNGSVKKYFSDISNGQLTYTNVVTVYLRVPNPKWFYNNTSSNSGPQAAVLIRDAINVLTNLPNYVSEILPTFDALTTTTNSTYRNVVALNVYFAGWSSGVWSKGLWPHAGSLWLSAVGRQYLSPTLRCSSYQITHMGSSLALGTFCHENGHLLCGFPDIYDYDGSSKGGAGSFCLMNNGNWDNNPAQVCAYLKNAAGWATLTDINSASTLTASVSATGTGFNHFYRYRKPGSTTEYYLIENRQKTGRDSYLPAAGIAIWHIDESGNKNNESLAYNTAHENYEVTLMQADNQWHLQRNSNYGDAQDLFYSGNPAGGYANAFTDTTGPGARWWDGSYSGINFRSFSARGNPMTFQVLPAPPTWRGDDVANVWNENTISNLLHIGNPVAFHAGDEVMFDDGGSAFPAIPINGNLQPGHVTVSAVQPYTFAGPGSLTGEMSLTKQGSGMLTIANTNTYTGDTVIESGILRLRGISAVAVANASFETPDNGTNAYVWTPAGSQWNYSGSGGGGCGIAKDNGWAASGFAGNQYLYAWHQGSASQTLNLEAGTYTVQFAYAGRNGYAAAGLRFYVDGLLKGSWLTSNDQQINYWINRTASFTIASSGAHTIMFDFPVPSPNPSGDWGGCVDAIEIYRHATNAPAGGIPSSSRVLLGAGAQLDVNGSQATVGPLGDATTTGGLVTNSSTGAATLTLNAASGTNTFTGRIVDGGSTRALKLVKAGAGTQVLGGSNTFSGGLFINAGTLALQGTPVSTVTNGSFETPVIAVGSYSGPANAGWTWSKTPGEVDGTGGMANGNTTWAPNAAQGNQYCYFWHSGLASQNIYFNPGTYTVTFSATGRPGYTPADLEFRVVRAGVTNTIAIWPSQSQGSTWMPLSATFTIATAGVHTIQFACTQPAGAYDWGSCIDDIRIPLPVSQVPALSTAIPSGTTVTMSSGGTLNLNGSSQRITALADGTNPGGMVTNSQVSAVTLTLMPASGSNGFSGSIRDDGSTRAMALVKTGGGTQTLLGTNRCSGGTTVSNGTLLVHGQLLGGAVSVNGGTLGGNGVIGGATTVKIGATLAPGASLGQLTISNALTLQAGSITRMELSNAPLTNDAVNVTGLLNLGGTLIVTNLGGAALAAGDAFQLFTAGSFSGNFAAVTLPLLGAGLFWNTNQLASQGLLSVGSTVPPVITGVSAGGGNLIFSGTGGTPGLSYFVLTSTNVALPVVNWTPVLTNTFDALGNFSVTNVMAPNSPSAFFQIRIE